MNSANGLTTQEVWNRFDRIARKKLLAGEPGPPYVPSRRRIQTQGLGILELEDEEGPFIIMEISQYGTIRQLTCVCGLNVEDHGFQPPDTIFRLCGTCPELIPEEPS